MFYWTMFWLIQASGSADDYTWDVSEGIDPDERVEVEISMPDWRE